MGFIWLVETPHTKHQRIADAVIGDFAVRLFASMDSLQKILRFSRRHLPDLLVINAGSMNWSLTQLVDFLKSNAPQVSCLLVGDNATAAATSFGLDRVEFVAYSLPGDGIKLSKKIVAILQQRRAGGKFSNTLVYKDLHLDFERLQIKLLPDERAQALPLKEAQILRMLLEMPGTCVSRERIIDHLWEGIVITPRTIDSHVSRLRKRLEGAETSIDSVYGGGYILR